MIFYTIARKLSYFATNQLKTAQKAKLVQKMLSQNPEAFKIFTQIVKIPELKILSDIFTTNGYELVFNDKINNNYYKYIIE